MGKSRSAIYPVYLPRTNHWYWLSSRTGGGVGSDKHPIILQTWSRIKFRTGGSFPPSNFSKTRFSKRKSRCISVYVCKRNNCVPGRLVARTLAGGVDGRCVQGYVVLKTPKASWGGGLDEWSDAYSQSVRLLYCWNSWEQLSLFRYHTIDSQIDVI